VFHDEARVSNVAQRLAQQMVLLEENRERIEGLQQPYGQQRTPDVL
jgi:hypothetical protein